MPKALLLGHPGPKYCVSKCEELLRSLTYQVHSTKTDDLGLETQTALAPPPNCYLAHLEFHEESFPSSKLFSYQQN